jgi:hypothetical protein
MKKGHNDMKNTSLLQNFVPYGKTKNWLLPIISNQSII